MTLRQSIEDFDDVMAFGKFKGRAVGWLVDNNPSYLLWLLDNKIVECDKEIWEAAMMSDMNQSPPEDFFFPDLGNR